MVTFRLTRSEQYSYDTIMYKYVYIIITLARLRGCMGGSCAPLKSQTRIPPSPGGYYEIFRSVSSRTVCAPPKDCIFAKKSITWRPNALYIILCYLRKRESRIQYRPRKKKRIFQNRRKVIFDKKSTCSELLLHRAFQYFEGNTFEIKYTDWFFVRKAKLFCPRTLNNGYDK